jgi:DUF1680 family protein
MKQWEGFGINYFLPQGTDEGGCYAETCASIGVMMVAERLLQVISTIERMMETRRLIHAQIDLDGKYADVMELSFFNVVMGSMSAHGTEFTYVNQLASSDSDLNKRFDWFQCACCPPNVTRLLGYLGGYFWTGNVDVRDFSVLINVHLYGSATLTVPIGNDEVKLVQKSDWPWDGSILFNLSVPKGIQVDLNLRIPGWAHDWEVRCIYSGSTFKFSNTDSRYHLPFRQSILLRVT